eukprot:XP_001702560.1 predicted protein of CLR family [Chlamydomonas reinhardtii]
MIPGFARQSWSAPWQWLSALTGTSTGAAGARQGGATAATGSCGLLQQHASSSSIHATAAAAEELAGGRVSTGTWTGHLGAGPGSGELRAALAALLAAYGRHLAYGCGKVGHVERPLLLPLLDLLAIRRRNLNEQMLANVLYSLALLRATAHLPSEPGGKPERKRGRWEPRATAAQGLTPLPRPFAAALTTAVAARVGVDFTPQEVASSLWSLMRLGVESSATADAVVAAACGPRFGKGANVQAWSNLLLALAALRHRPGPELLAAAVTCGAPGLIRRTARTQECTNTMWSLGTLVLYDQELVDGVAARMLQLARTRPDTWTTQAISNALWALAVMGRDAMTRHEEVMSVESEGVVPELTFRVDLLVTLAGGRRLAVEVDGPHHYMANPPYNQMHDGSTEIRNRQLEFVLGADGVITVPHWEWLRLRHSPELKEAYLARRLQGLNAGKREFGEFGGVNASVEISTTFTVLDANTLEAIFAGAPDKGGCYVLTKFVSGASDIIGGAVCGPAAFIRGLMDFHAGPCMLLGPTMDPRVASELALRLPHLALRMQFMERLQNKHGFGFMAVSLGYFDTLMSLSAASTSSELSDKDMDASGIGRGYLRMSVGITGSLEERWRQLEESYNFVRALGPAATAPFRAVKLRRRASGGIRRVGSTEIHYVPLYG